MKTTQLTIENLSSPADASHIQKALEAVPGVKAAAVEIDVGRATVEHEQADEQKLAAAIHALGFSTQLIPEKAEVMAPPLPPL